MNLEQYIKEYHEGRSDWFIEEVQSVTNQQRVMNVLNLKDYLNGSHKILQKQPYIYNGKELVLCQENGHVKQREIAEFIQLPFSD